MLQTLYDINPSKTRHNRQQHTTQSRLPIPGSAAMLDVQDFITERGGDPEKIRESLRVSLPPSR